MLYADFGVNLGLILVHIQNYRIPFCILPAWMLSHTLHHPETLFSWFSLTLFIEKNWLNQDIEDGKNITKGMSILCFNKCVQKSSRVLIPNKGTVSYGTKPPTNMTIVSGQHEKTSIMKML